MPGHLVCIAGTVGEWGRILQQLLFLFKGSPVAGSGDLLAQQGTPNRVYLLERILLW